MKGSQINCVASDMGSAYQFSKWSVQKLVALLGVWNLLSFRSSSKEYSTFYLVHLTWSYTEEFRLKQEVVVYVFYLREKKSLVSYQIKLHSSLCLENFWLPHLQWAVETHDDNMCMVNYMKKKSCDYWQFKSANKIVALTTSAMKFSGMKTLRTNLKSNQAPYNIDKWYFI